MEVDSAIASSLIGAAATIIVAVIGKPSQAERGRNVDRDIEILKLLDQMDRPSQDGEMHALKVEVARKMVDKRMEVSPMSDREQTLAVAARHPFLTFYAFWLLSYLLLGGEDTGSATLLACACCALDIAKHLLGMLDLRLRSKER